MKLLGNIYAVVPGPLIIWLTGYMNLLVDVGLAHPHWSETAHNLALAMAVILALLTVVYLSKFPTHAVTIAFCSGALFFAALIICCVLKYKTETAATVSAIEGFKENWLFAYVAMAVLFAEAAYASIAALLIDEDKGHKPTKL